MRVGGHRRRILVRLVAILVGCGQLACDPPDEVQPLSSSPTAGLTGTEWRLVQLDGGTTDVGAGASAPTLLLTATDTRVSGFAGCNRLMGSYELTGARLRFSQLATTRMFCANTMDLEQRYLAALEATRTYRLTGRELDLTGDRGVVARFRAP